MQSLSLSLSLSRSLQMYSYFVPTKFKDRPKSS